MPRFNEIINNFVNGEVSPKIYGRSDSEIYKRSARNILNKVVHPQGGTSRRLGSVMDIETIYESASDPVAHGIDADARCFPFVYSKDESYLIIFPANAVFSTNKFLAWDQVTRRLIPISFTGGSSGGYAGDSIGAGAVSANLLTSGTLLSEIQYAQNGAVMVFTHRDLPPFYIYRSSKGLLYGYDFYRPFIGGVVSEVDMWSRWPYDQLNTTTTTMTISATALGSRTLTASVATFTANDVGTMIMATNAGITGAGMITAYTSTTVVTVNVMKVWPGTGAYTTWAKSAWSYTKGYPRSVCFTPDQRTLYGFTKSEPEKMWASQVGDIYELSNHDTLTPGSTLTADDPCNFSGAAVEANEGLWLRSSPRNVLMGTRGREYSIDNIDGSGTPTAEVTPQTGYGSEAVQPALVDDVPVFVQRGFKKLREMVFEFKSDAYVAPEVSYLAEHIFFKSQKVLGDLNVSKIKQLAYQALDNNILWAIDTNGYLYGCTKSRENQVTAFHRHELGGNYGGDYPRVSSICSLPSANGTSDNLWMVVTRTINGASKTTIERLPSEFRGTSLHSDLETVENQPVYMDAAKIFRPKASGFWAKLSANATATYAAGSTTATTTGTVSYAQGWAYCSAASYISWDGTSNADFAQTGCVEFEFRYGPGGGMTSPAHLLAISNASGGSNNLISVFYTSAGDLSIHITNSAGANIIASTIVGNLGTLIWGLSGFVDTFKFELNYDLTAGATRVFINGKQLGSTISSTGTRTTAIDLIRLNATFSGSSSRADIGYRNLRIHSTVQHTADFEIFEPNQLSTTLRGLDHLEGEDVVVLANGLYLDGTYTVASGAITLPDDIYTTVIVGLPYQHILEIQPIDAGTGIGSATGSIKRIDRAVIRIRDTAALNYGPTVDDQTAVVLRDAATDMDDPITLVTDDAVIEFPGDYDRQARVVIAGSEPLPCNVTCMSLRGVTGDV